MAVQWLRLCTSTAGSTGSIPGQGTKILHAARHGQKKQKKVYNLALCRHPIYVSVEDRTLLGTVLSCQSCPCNWTRVKSLVSLNFEKAG